MSLGYAREQVRASTVYLGYSAARLRSGICRAGVRSLRRGIGEDELLQARARLLLSYTAADGARIRRFGGMLPPVQPRGVRAADRRLPDFVVPGHRGRTCGLISCCSTGTTFLL